MKDSGERQEFQTGAVRDTNDGKPRPDFISPCALLRLGEWLRIGAEKYADRNWEKGMPTSRYLASLWRHLLALQDGDRSEDHAAAVMFNIMAFIHTEEMVARGVYPVELSDHPSYFPQPSWVMVRDGMAKVKTNTGEWVQESIERPKGEDDRVDLIQEIADAMKEED